MNTAATRGYKNLNASAPTPTAKEFVELASSLKNAWEIIAWAGVITILALVTVFFWAYVGLVLAVVVPLGIIVSVIRSLVNEFRRTDRSRRLG